MMHVADTHALIWYAYEDPRLGGEAKRALQEAEHGHGQVLVPTIVLAEAMWMIEDRGAREDFILLLDHVERHPNFSVISFDGPTLRLAAALGRGLDIHDRIIAATAISNHATLLTRDRRLRAVCHWKW